MKCTTELIGERIKTERERLKLSQTALADKIGLNEEFKSDLRGIVSRWEIGKVKPSAENLVKLCGLFNCEIGYLFGEIDKPTRAVSDIHTVTGLSDKAIENLQNLQTLILKKGKFTDGRLDNQDIVNLLLEHDGFSVIQAIADLFNTPKETSTLLHVKTPRGEEKTVCTVNMWAAVLTWVQETLSQTYDRVKRRHRNGE